MMKMNKREIILLTLAIIIIGGSTMYKRVLSPILKKSGAVKKEVLEKRNYINQMEFRLKNEKRYLTDLKIINKKIENIESHLYSGNEGDIKIEILNRIQKNINGSGLIIKDKNIWIEKSLENENQKNIYCNVNLEGDFNSMIKWLQVSNTGGKLLESEKLEIVKNRNVLLINGLYRSIIYGYNK